MLLGVAVAEASGDLAALTEAQGFDAAGFVERLLNGEGYDPGEIVQGVVGRIAEAVRSSFTEMFAPLMLPVAAFAVLRLVLNGSDDTIGTMRLMCVLCCAVALARCFLFARHTAEGFLNMMSEAAMRLAPAQTAAAALGGDAVSSAVLRSLSAWGSAFITGALRDIGLKLCTAAAMVAAAGNLSERFPLKRLFGLVRSAVHWLLGGLTLMFGGMMAAQGLAVETGNTAARRAVGVALESLVPIIGGQVSDAAGALIVTAGAARRAVGLAGAVLIARMCIKPLAAVGASAISVKLAASIVEPLAEDPVAELMGQFGEVLEMLLAVCACGGVMAAMLAGGLARLVS